MKIDPNLEILKSQYVQKTSVAEKPAGKEDAFSVLLKEAIEGDPSKKPMEGPMKTAMISNISPVQFPPFFAVQENPVAERTEKFLDLLEEYQSKLLDPNLTLRDIHPLLERMETEKDALVPLLDSLPSGDRLRDVLNNALVASTVETFKFNRGDYV